MLRVDVDCILLQNNYSEFKNISFSFVNSAHCLPTVMIAKNETNNKDDPNALVDDISYYSLF